MKKQKEIKKIPAIINCDPGIDDAIALIMAIKSDIIDVKLITTDLGNVSTTQSAQNTLNVLELIGANDIPVACGEGKCLEIERPRVAVHGKTGLGSYVFPKNSRKILKGDAVDIMYQTIMAEEEKTTLICLSPPTNIAKMLLKYPDAKDKIERLVFMVGSIEQLKRGALPYAEFNVAGDPEASKAILKSKVKLEIVPMEMGHTAYLDWQDVFKTKNMNFVGSVLENLYREYKDRHVKNGIATHDSCAIAYITNPEIFKIEPVKVDIKYYDKLGTGVFVMNFDKTPNALTCTEIDVKKFKKLYFKMLKKCK